MIIPIKVKPVFKWLGDSRESDKSVTSYGAAAELPKLVLCLISALHRPEAKLLS